MHRKISKWIFTEFITDNGWMEIYYKPDCNLIRYITPMGIQVDTIIHKDGEVEVMSKLKEN